MITNETQCSNCGQEIKNVIYIGGKPFGTTCAERKLGQKLPLNFSGDYDAYAIEAANQQEVLKREQKADEQRVIELWEDAMLLAGVWSNTNDWGREFLLSISSQLGYSGLLNCIGSKQYKSAQEYINSDYVKQYGLFAHSSTKSINELSDKQQQLINRI